MVLEKTRNADATDVGKSFVTAWGSLRADQQMVIQKQVWIMRKKKLPLRPHLFNYFGAIANAVSIEQADPTKISEFLRLPDKYWKMNLHQKWQASWRAAEHFFSTMHSIMKSRSGLYARDDDYSFDYIIQHQP